MGIKLKDMRSVRVGFKPEGLALFEGIRALVTKIKGFPEQPSGFDEKMLKDVGYCIYSFVSEKDALKFRGEVYKLVPSEKHGFVKVEILPNYIDKK